MCACECVSVCVLVVERKQISIGGSSEDKWVLSFDREVTGRILQPKQGKSEEKLMHTCICESIKNDNRNSLV